MASLIYNSCLDDAARALLDFDSHSFKVMLTTNSYTEDKDAHDRRDDITNEVVGAGYTAGGVAVVATVTKDTVNDRIDVSFAAVTWPASTITARKAVYYRVTGGAASTDNLVAVVDFGVDVSTTASTFSLASSIIRMQN